MVTSQEVVNHNDPVVENLEVLQVISSTRDTNECVWTFVYPGCHIYQWRTGEQVTTSNERVELWSSPQFQSVVVVFVVQGQRCVRARLDCSKLVPSSESLRTISGIDEHFSPGRCQIASMTIQRGKLYAGTSWGCLIVADAVTMRPVSVFRPYSEEIQAIIPLAGSGSGGGGGGTGSKAKRGGGGGSGGSGGKQKDKSAGGEDEEEELLLVTLGKGYRSLIGRFVSGGSGWGGKRRPGKMPGKTGGGKDVDDDDEEEEEGDGDNARIMTALLWKPDDWLAD